MVFESSIYENMILLREVALRSWFLGFLKLEEHWEDVQSEKKVSELSPCYLKISHSSIQYNVQSKCIERKKTKKKR